MLWALKVPSGLHADDYVLLEGLAPWISGVARAWSGTVLGAGVDYCYRPVTFSVLAITGSFDSPFAIRCVSAALHLSVGLLVFTIASILVRDHKRGLFAMFLVMFHQAVVMPVYWVSSIGDLLLTFFGLLAYLQFIRNRPGTMGLFLSLALLSKETAVTIPVIMLLSAILRGDLREKGRMIALSCLLTVGFLIVRYFMIDAYVAGGANRLYFNVQSHTVRGVLRYFRELASPFPLSSLDPQNVLWAGILAAGCWAVAFRTSLSPKRAVRLGLCIAIVVLPLVPVFAVFGKWYLYAPVALLAVVIAHAPLTRFTVLWLGVMSFSGCMAMHYYSHCFAKSYEIQQDLLSASENMKEPVAYAKWPAMACKDVPVFSWNRQGEAAYRKRFGLSKRFK